MSFCEDVWRRVAPLRAAIAEMPFNKALSDGSLPRETFQFYMLQDSLYLEGYSRTLSLLSAKAPETPMMLEFAQAAQVALVVERSLHEGVFRANGLDDAAVKAAEPSPTCLNYVNFLVATAHQASIEEAVAAVLPCFWVYEEVGNAIHARAAADNPYRAWIDTYASEDFAAAVRRVIAIADALAAEASPSRVDRMAAAFVRSVQFEWMFWDSAWRRESWPV
ncbi:thiaminase II [Iodidimonas sp. SYSU 1G8]|uniref:thiaminase II n=1 Tax=Iodidimonas sp. SYSU 1G8 TaxID=3133967 RepID=UPI0031FE621E